MSIEVDFEIIFNDVYDEAEKIVNDEPLTTKNVISLVTKIMQLVEKINGMDGEAKKALVIDVLVKVFETSNLDVETEESISNLIEYSLPDLIDTIIAASKHQFDLNSTVGDSSAIKRFLSYLNCSSCNCLRE